MNGPSVSAVAANALRSGLQGAMYGAGFSFALITLQQLRELVEGSTTVVRACRAILVRTATGALSGCVVAGAAVLFSFFCPAVAAVTLPVVAFLGMAWLGGSLLREGLALARAVCRRVFFGRNHESQHLLLAQAEPQAAPQAPAALPLPPVPEPVPEPVPAPVAGLELGDLPPWSVDSLTCPIVRTLLSINANLLLCRTD